MVELLRQRIFWMSGSSALQFVPLTGFGSVTQHNNPSINEIIVL
jgi:hypothetical protein